MFVNAKKTIFIATLAMVAVTTIGALRTDVLTIKNGSADALHSQSEALAIPSSYILQGSNTERLVDAVQNVGGTVDDVFPIINAVSAVLTPSQADQLSTKHRLRVKNDRTLTLSSLAEKYKTVSADGVVDNFVVRQTNADDIHNLGITGEGVGIAILDSGINLFGQNRALRYKKSGGQSRVTKYSAISRRVYTSLGKDFNGHGTHLASIIADTAQSQSSFNGIAPDANLISVRAFDANGVSSYSRILNGLNWVFDNHEQYNIRVLNMSFGVAPDSMYYDDPINQAVMKLWDAGVVVVVSAGNNGEQFGITVPGNNPYVITVGAATDNTTPYTFDDDRVTSFSAQGPTFEGFVKPDLVAYGGQIASRVYDWKGRFNGFNKLDYADQYIQMSGTSQAAAITTGIAALVIANHPNISPDDVKCKLTSTATRLRRNASGTLYTPLEQGAGRIDAKSAVLSNKLACANRGLDLSQDLAGTQHFRGPVLMDDDGDLHIRQGNENVLIDSFKNPNNTQTQNNWWGSSDTALQRTWWDGGEMALQRNWWDGAESALQRAWWGGDRATLQNAWWVNDSDNSEMKSLSLQGD